MDFLRLVLNRLSATKAPSLAIPTGSFASKTILVTGSNTGLGLYAAEHFVRLKAARVILGVRSVSKGEVAKATIESNTGCGKGIVEVMQCDMSSFQTVQDFAQRLEKQTERLDVALLNAGRMDKEYRTAVDGWEETLEVNTLSTTLLALLLLPLLRATKEAYGVKSQDHPHLLFTSSGMHAKVKREDLPETGPILPTLNEKDAFPGPQPQYARSKLLLLYAAKEIAALCTAPNGEVHVIVTSCSPGFCKSDLGRTYDAWYHQLLVPIAMALFARSTEEGSRNLVGAATLGVEGQGGYWKDDILSE